LDAIAGRLPSLDAEGELARFVDRGEVPELGGLGPCHRVVPRDFLLFAAGFDVAATLQSSDGHPVALDPKGPAARAGLLATDVVRFVELQDGRTDVPVEIGLERGGKPQKLSYAPIGATVRGVAVERVPSRPELECLQGL